MDKIEKIRQEIERRKNICEGVFERESDTYYQGKAVAYGELLTFLNTLSEEPDKSLEEEIDRFEDWMETYNQADYPTSFTTRDIARHFAQWGADHTPLPEDTVIFNKGIEEGKRLMLKDAVEGKIEEVSFNNGELHNTIFFSFDEESLHVESRIWVPRCGKDGDKVRIIIVKED